MKNCFFKSSMWLASSFVALSFALPNPALAQDGLSTNTVDDEVIVTGIRASLKESADLKREAIGVVDAISATDIGRFPDENIAESMQRITGVQISRLRGEGQNVNIRGLPSEFTRVQFNDFSLPSAARNGETSSTRNFDFTVLPSEFVRTLEVHKSPSADLEEGGLSGTIVVRTPRPFDFSGRKVALSAQGAWNSNSGDFAPRASGLFSDRFGDGNFGITVGGAYSQRKPDTHQLDFRGFSPRAEVNGFSGSADAQDFNNDGDTNDTVGVPFLVFYNLFDEERERLSGFASIQATPFEDKNFELYLDAFYTELEVGAVRFENLYFPRNATGPVNADGTDVRDLGDGAAVTAVLDADGVDLRGGSRFEDRVVETYSLALGGDYEVGPWTFSAKAGFSKSEQNGNNLNIATQARGRVVVDSITDGDIVGVTNVGGFEQARLDSNSFRFLSINGEFQRLDETKRTDLRFDVDRNIDLGFINSLEAGIQFSDTSEFHDQGRLVINGDQIGALTSLPDFPGGGVSAAPFMNQIQSNRGDFLGAYNGPASFPQVWLGSDTAGFLSQFSESELRAAGTFSNNSIGIIDVNEEVLAGYAKANFLSADERLSGNVGLRIVKTKQSSVGRAADLNDITLFPDAGEVTEVGSLGDIEASRSYTELLPSATLKYEFAPDLIGRVSASRTMTRPELARISPATTVNGTASTINTQNPNLDPFLATNFDVSAEWYLGDSKSLTAAVFYKDIESLIRLDTQTVSQPITLEFADGSRVDETREFQVTSPINGEGVSLTGFELGLQYGLDFLPAPFDNIGVLGNYTYIDNSDPEELTGSSKHNYNLSGYYETDKIGMRLSYTWRDDFLINPTSGFGVGSTQLARGVLDGNITYNINDRFSVLVEATNLLDTADQSQFRNGVANIYTDAGRRILFGARANF